jgi:hypothetical protein
MALDPPDADATKAELLLRDFFLHAFANYPVEICANIECVYMICMYVCMNLCMYCRIFIKMKCSYR